MITIGNLAGTEQPVHHNAVRIHTGKGLNEWLATIDAWDGDKRRLHSLIDYLMQTHHLSYGWAQVIALYYLYKRV